VAQCNLAERNLAGRNLAGRNLAERNLADLSEPRQALTWRGSDNSWLCRGLAARCRVGWSMSRKSASNFDNPTNYLSA
jgi:hypothetical protein